MTVSETADYLRVARSTVYRLMREGGLTSYRVGTRRLVRRSDVEAWMESQQERHVPESRRGDSELLEAREALKQSALAGPGDPDWMNVYQCADYLGVSANRVYKMKHEGMPSHTVGGYSRKMGQRYIKSEVDDWVKTHPLRLI